MHSIEVVHIINVWSLMFISSFKLVSYTKFGSCYLVSLGHKLRNPNLEVLYWKEQNFDFEKLNEVECTTFKTVISILNFLAYVLSAHVSIT